MPLAERRSAVANTSVATPRVEMAEPALATEAGRTHADIGSGSTRPASGRAIASEALFTGSAEVVIVHRGQHYRLRQTALGKLILTK